MSSPFPLQVSSDNGVRLKKRKANFSFSEVHILLDEVKKNRHVVVGKFNSGVPSDVKRRKWTEITQSINEIGECDREVGEVIKKWSDLECDTKRKVAALHSGAPQPYSSDLTQAETIVGSILNLDKKLLEAAQSSRKRSRSEDQDGAGAEEGGDVAVQGSPRSGSETRTVPPPSAATGSLSMKCDGSTTADADLAPLDSDDDQHDALSSPANNSCAEEDVAPGNAAAERDGAREQLAQSASLSVQEQHMTNALLGTVSRSLELLAESVQQLAETQQEFARESLRLQRETVHVLRDFASGALTLLHERVNGKPPLL
ncbi:nuclear apoptosis-inducing factor 1 [Trichomycterus rosablanca]|uniref:nuclear apoptosis-inducing factor 1 n=1 Tax=Trichomycterus rosablanca TaxID=2290929 RepID=UPI002F358B01